MSDPYVYVVFWAPKDISRNADRLLVYVRFRVIAR